METLTLTNSVTNSHLDLEQQQRDQSSLEQQQHMVNLGDMTDLTDEMQEGIVSIPREIILISLVSQEQSLYNPRHEFYRNTQRKDSKWLEISGSVGWSETQCKAKWKAMRDQYCRELKRSKFNSKANVKWKYFKELDFLRPYALSRSYRPRHLTSGVVTTPNNNSYNTIGGKNINNNSSGVSSNNTAIIDNNNKFTNVKVKPGFNGGCEYTANTTTTMTTTAKPITVPEIKSENPAPLMSSFTEDQLDNVIRQDVGWSYLAAATNTTPSTSSASIIGGAGVSNSQSSEANSNNNHHHHNSLDSNSLLQEHDPQQQQQQTATTEDVFINIYGGVTAAIITADSHNVSAADEEDDDSIHTYLNIESYFERDLIIMVQQQDVLYNRFHPNYRNVKLKWEVWDDISRKLKKPVKQCRLKWKALRDQYIREHKRLKNHHNVDTLPRWKNYDSLNFLEKFIKHKSGELSSNKNVRQIPKNEIDVDMDDDIISDSPLPDSPLTDPAVSVVGHDLHQQQQQHIQLQTLPSLTGPHHITQQQHQQLQHSLQQHMEQHRNNDSLCTAVTVSTGGAGGSSASAYDEMDIDNYIIGNETDDEVQNDVEEAVHDVNDEDGGVDDVNEDHKSPQRFADYTATGEHNNMRSLNEDLDENADNNDVVGFNKIKSSPHSQNGTHLLQQQRQQRQQQQQQLQQHHEHIISVIGTNTNLTATITLSDESLQAAANQQHLEQQQQTQHDYNIEAQQQQHQPQRISNTVTSPNHASTLLLNGVAAPTLNACHSSNSNNNSNLVAETLNMNVPAVVSKSQATTRPIQTMHTNQSQLQSQSQEQQHQQHPQQQQQQQQQHSTQMQLVNNNNNNIAGEDDEVGVFFKAVAMKIRNTKMTPVEFTELQINILRAINGTLRHQ